MFKYILTVCTTFLFFSHTVFAVENQWVIENEWVQVDEAELRTITQGLLKSGQIPRGKLSSQYVEKAAKEFILHKALAMQAQKLGLDRSAEVKKLIEMNQNRLLGMIYLSDYSDNVKLPDFESIAFENYSLNKKQFMQAETVNAQHILIHFDGDENKSQLFAKDIREKIIQAKKSFSDLAKEYSNDPSATENGGNLGFFDKNQMVSEFSDAAFSLKVGEISQPVKSQFGWHIIQVLEKNPAKQLAFSEVKDSLILTAEQNFKQEARNNKIRDTVYTPKLKVNEDLINKIVHDLSGE